MIFSPNTGKCGPEKNPCLATFHAVSSKRILLSMLLYPMSDLILNITVWFFHHDHKEQLVYWHNISYMKQKVRFLPRERNWGRDDNWAQQVSHEMICQLNHVKANSVFLTIRVQTLCKSRPFMTRSFREVKTREMFVNSAEFPLLVEDLLHDWPVMHLKIS